MNFSDLEVIRFTIHKIFSRKDLRTQKDSTPYAEPCKEFCNLQREGQETLKNRIVTATSYERKFFELDFEDTSSGSFWNNAHKIFGSPRKDFISIANKIADKAAEAHEKGNIPGGVLLIVECRLGISECLAVIKAERSKAFSLSGSNMKLINELFLSTDKTLYKIGFLVKTGTKSVSPVYYKPFVYDDSFSAAKEDLAYYFYHNFLGFSTEKNSKLQTNNFYKHIASFTDEFIQRFGDRNTIMKVIDSDMVSKRKKIIQPDDYKSLFPEEIHEEYNRYVSSRLPRAIVKDISVLPDLDSKRIKINDSAVLLAKNGIGKEIVVLDGVSEKNFNAVRKLFLDTGKNGKVVIIPSSANDR